MDGRAFLQSAQALLAGPSEANWRSAVGRAYYALLHEGQSALLWWGVPKPAGEQLHQFVRQRFGFTAHPDLRQLGMALDDLSRLRNQADYQLIPTAIFGTAGRSLTAVRDAENMIVLLDAIDGDPVRRGGVIAALRLRWP